jgi:hypothetical protein
MMVEGCGKVSGAGSKEFLTKGSKFAMRQNGGVFCKFLQDRQHRIVKKVNVLRKMDGRHEP